VGGVSTGPSEAPSEAAASILDTLRVGTLMLDAEGRVLLWTPTAGEILGWRVDQVVGRQVRDFLEDGYGEGEEERRRVLRRDHQWRGIMRVRHSDGGYVAIEGRISLLWDRENRPLLLANIVETSRIRSVEHDLAALDALFASSPLGIALFDTEKRYERVNGALAELNGIPVEEHTGKTIDEVLPPWMVEELGTVQAFVLETGQSVLDMVIPGPGNSGSRSISYSRLIDAGGEVLGFSCVIMDITERYEAMRKVEAARQRLTLLDDVGLALGERLDVDAVSEALASSLVPRFCDYAAVLLIRAVGQGGDLPRTDPQGDTALYLRGVAARHEEPAVDAMLRSGEEVRFLPDSLFARTLATGTPYLTRSREDLTSATYPGDPRVQAAFELDIHSLMTIPLRARGIVLGLLVISRSGGRDPFEDDDLALGMELADRAGISLDNARLYARERGGALVLQRSLLPQRVPEPPGVRVAYRYVPGSSGTEVGGDWFDVVPLAGGRVALVVGDVMGHGLNAAVTMGRLRTAVRTLAGLDMQPDELLRRVNDLADDFGQGPDDPVIATCVYAVYDPSTRRCVLAAAGHPPPLLLSETEGGGWRAEALELPPGAPIGVGGVSFESVEHDIAEGSVLALYTDGLIENRGEDITVGIERLRRMLSCEPGSAWASASLEEICEKVTADLERRTGSQPEDDVALLFAKLGGLPEGSTASWTFPAERSAARGSREVVRETLRQWGLEALEDEALLLVSELVTNSLRYARGPIEVRMVRGVSLLVEVSDPLPDPPRERTVTPEDEGGRGIQLVAREARRWGTRYGAVGKTVWFELAMP
jgi:PAS domain S-box-containing protein